MYTCRVDAVKIWDRRVVVSGGLLEADVSLGQNRKEKERKGKEKRNESV